MPETVKQQKKQEVVQAMLKDVSFLLGSYMTGASQAALATGNVQTIATDIALNKLIGTLVPSTPVTTNSYDYNYDYGSYSVDPKDAAYQTLDLTAGASADQVRSAYKKLAMKYHPDKNYGDASAIAKFQEVNEAYQLLMNK